MLFMDYEILNLVDFWIWLHFMLQLHSQR